MPLTDIFHLIASLGCLLLLVKSVTPLTNKCQIPSVLVEILLGILIGPTCLASFFPDASQWLFPVTGAMGESMQQLSKITVIALLFTAGLETDLKSLRSEGKTILSTAVGSMLIPFAAGSLIVLCIPALFRVPPEQSILPAAFIGVAFAISALPVIIRILMDLDLYHSRIGTITVTAASLMDLVGWLAFGVILNCLHPFSLESAAQMLWSHATLLSFIAGILIGNTSIVPEAVKHSAQRIIVLLLSPFFFLSFGRKVNFIEHLDIVLVIAIILIACASKISGTIIGAKLGGLKKTDALAIGFALNARGAMEIMLSQQALEAGLIHTDLFVALVIMALFTSMLSAPAIQSVLSPAQHHKGKRHAPAFATEAEQVFAE